MTTLFDRSYALAAGILTLGLVVLVLVVRDLNVTMPILPRLEPSTAGSGVFGPASKRMPELFAPTSFANLTLVTNLPPPFATTFFQPAPRQAVVPAANTTRKVTLTYNGFFETGTGEKRAYVQVGDSLKVLPPGASVVSDLIISNIQRGELTLTRAATQAVVISFRASKEVEVSTK